MIFEQFYLGCLAQASYLLGSDGIAAVVDPQRDVDLYLEYAEQHGLKIAHVIETHLHADFVSGHRELAERTGATIYLGNGSGATFPHNSVKDGDEITFGRCRLRFLHTPGHTLESMCVLVTDLERGADPWAVLTGDTLFIGDAGRPDLSGLHTPQELAGLLYDSLHHKLLNLDDAVEVFPAHGAGSICGRNISADRSSTIGRERRFNYALRPMARDKFVEVMTHELPPRPRYFERDVDLNRRGAGALSDLPKLSALEPCDVLVRNRSGAVILDTRASGPFCSGHIPGGINIGLGGQFASWAGSVIGLDRDIILVAEDEAAVDEAQQRLARVGIERVIGFLRDGVAGWLNAGLKLEPTSQLSVNALDAELRKGDGLRFLDVRRPGEWQEGHVPNAQWIPLDELEKRIGELGRENHFAVYCKSGYRSTIACSMLQSAGFGAVSNILGGFDAWSAANLPVVSN